MCIRDSSEGTYILSTGQQREARKKDITTHAHVHVRLWLLQEDGRNQKEGICMCSIDRIEALRAVGGDGLTASHPLSTSYMVHYGSILLGIRGEALRAAPPLPTGWPDALIVRREVCDGTYSVN